MNYPIVLRPTLQPAAGRRNLPVPLPVALLPVFVLVFVVLGGFMLTRTITITDLAQAEPPVAVANTVAQAGAGAVQPPAAPVIGSSSVAAAFMPSVRYWGPQIEQWAAAHQLDPNLVATVMQIESCGHPGAISGAGAQGLFQVMPFHFAAGEDMLDPNTNAARGMAYLALGLQTANGNAGLAMAGYNGGHSVIGKASSNWPNETQRYYHWGNNIYAEVQANPNESPTLQQWLTAGGSSLCAQANQALGLNTAN